MHITTVVFPNGNILPTCGCILKGYPNSHQSGYGHYWDLLVITPADEHVVVTERALNRDLPVLTRSELWEMRDKIAQSIIGGEELLDLRTKASEA